MCIVRTTNIFCIGKTTIATFIIERASLPPGSTLLYCLCSQAFDLPASEFCTLVFRVFAGQILRKSPDLVLFVYEEFVKKAEIPSLRVLLPLLRVLLLNLPSSFIVVDGLDECGQAAQALFVKKLDHLLSAQRASEATLTLDVKILVSSRDTKTIPNRLRRSPTISLSAEAEHVSRDIKLYIMRNINELKDRFSEDQVGHIAQEIVNKANGMFLWVRLVTNTLLEQQSLQDLQDTVHKLPSSLKGLYQTILERIETRADDKQKIYVRNIFTWMVYSREPLQSWEICAALVFSVPGQQLNDRTRLEKGVIDCCKPLLEEHVDGRLSFIHFSVKEYLLKGKGTYILDPSAANNLLSAVCIRYLLTTDDFFRHESSAKSCKEVILGFHVLFPYVQAHWCDHLLDSSGYEARSTPSSQISLMALQQESSKTPLRDHILTMSILENARQSIFQEARSQIKPSTSAVNDAMLDSLQAISDTMQEAEEDQAPRSQSVTAIGCAYQRFRDRFEALILGKCAFSLSELNVTDVEMSSFMSRHARGAFTCPWPDCLWRITGFSSCAERDRHYRTHLSRLCCPEVNCDFATFSFANKAALRQHQSNYHDIVSARPLPKLKLSRPSAVSGNVDDQKQTRVSGMCQARDPTFAPSIGISTTNLSSPEPSVPEDLSDYSTFQTPVYSNITLSPAIRPVQNINSGQYGFPEFDPPQVSYTRWNHAAKPQIMASSMSLPPVDSWVRNSDVSSHLEPIEGLKQANDTLITDSPFENPDYHFDFETLATSDEASSVHAKPNSKLSSTNAGALHEHTVHYSNNATRDETVSQESRNHLSLYLQDQPGLNPIMSRDTYATDKFDDTAQNLTWQNPRAPQSMQELHNSQATQRHEVYSRDESSTETRQNMSTPTRHSDFGVSNESAFAATSGSVPPVMPSLLQPWRTLTREDNIVINAEAASMAKRARGQLQQIVNSMDPKVRQSLAENGIDPLIYHCRVKATDLFREQEAQIMRELIGPALLASCLSYLPHGGNFAVYSAAYPNGPLHYVEIKPFLDETLCALGFKLVVRSPPANFGEEIDTLMTSTQLGPKLLWANGMRSLRFSSSNHASVIQRVVDCAKEIGEQINIELHLSMRRETNRTDNELQQQRSLLAAEFASIFSGQQTTSDTTSTQFSMEFQWSPGEHYINIYFEQNVTGWRDTIKKYAQISGGKSGLMRLFDSFTEAEVDGMNDPQLLKSAQSAKAEFFAACQWLIQPVLESEWEKYLSRVIDAIADAPEEVDVNSILPFWLSTEEMDQILEQHMETSKLSYDRESSRARYWAFKNNLCLNQWRHSDNLQDRAPPTISLDVSSDHPKTPVAVTHPPVSPSPVKLRGEIQAEHSDLITRNEHQKDISRSEWGSREATSLFSNESPFDDPFYLDFSTLENADLLENFDFDSFLNTDAESYFDFGRNDTSTEVAS